MRQFEPSFGTVFGTVGTERTPASQQLATALTDLPTRHPSCGVPEGSKVSRGNPEPWLRKGRGYFVTLGGVQHNLRTHKEVEAFNRWHQLIAEQGQTPRQLDDDPLVVDLFAVFCEWAAKHLAHASYVWYRNYLRGLVTQLDRDLKTSRFKPDDVTGWLDKNPQCGARAAAAAPLPP